MGEMLGQIGNPTMAPAPGYVMATPQMLGGGMGQAGAMGGGPNMGGGGSPQGEGTSQGPTQQPSGQPPQ
jgi:hypothetical protein